MQTTPVPRAPRSLFITYRIQLAARTVPGMLALVSDDLCSSARRVSWWEKLTCLTRLPLLLHAAGHRVRRYVWPAQRCRLHSISSGSVGQ